MIVKNRCAGRVSIVGKVLCCLSGLDWETGYVAISKCFMSEFSQLWMGVFTFIFFEKNPGSYLGCNFFIRREISPPHICLGMV